MGTYYRVVLAEATPAQAKTAENRIREVLDRVSRSMSIFDSGSEVSRFNKYESGTAFCPSPDLAQVMQVSFMVHEMTGGAFDPTLGPVIDLWGFGRGARDRKTIPDQAGIDQAMKWKGLDMVVKDEMGCLVKEHPGVQLNLSGVAKGYGVDAVAEKLRDMGIGSFLVDIGGDVYAGDKRPGGPPWKVGISSPHQGTESRDFIHVITLENQAIATSGDYHNYFMHDGRRYSHIMDPATGRPVSGGIISATVRAEECVLADALATAMMVMDLEESLALAKGSGLFEVLLVIENPNRELSIHYSSGFWKGLPNDQASGDKTAD